MPKLIIIACFFSFFLGIACNSTTSQATTENSNDSSLTKPVVEVINSTIFQTKEGTFDTLPNKYGTHFEPIMLYSEDSLEVYGNYYHAANDAKSILLCHQATWNKSEYDSSAVALKEMGFNCLAIDQRSGGIIPFGGENVGPINQTTLKAVEAGKGIDYLDARQDIRAAINYLYEKNGNQPIILWGSSYSSTLALYLGINNDKVAAVVSFSPGDYFADSLGSLIPLLKDTEKPFFITSSKKEAPELSSYIKGKELNEKQVQFIPKETGHHGSRALWLMLPGNEEYWQAINAYLKQIK